MRLIKWQHICNFTQKHAYAFFFLHGKPLVFERLDIPMMRVSTLLYSGNVHRTIEMNRSSARQDPSVVFVLLKMQQISFSKRLNNSREELMSLYSISITIQCINIIVLLSTCSQTSVCDPVHGGNANSCEVSIINELCLLSHEFNLPVNNGIMNYNFNY